MFKILRGYVNMKQVQNINFKNIITINNKYCQFLRYVNSNVTLRINDQNYLF